MIPAIAYAMLMCLITAGGAARPGHAADILLSDAGACSNAATSNLMLTGLGLAGGCVGAVGAYFMFDHVKKRVSIWINPWSDPIDSGYQIVAGTDSDQLGRHVRAGAGGWARRAWIPYYHTDFIFAAICEEFRHTVRGADADNILLYNNARIEDIA